MKGKMKTCTVRGSRLLARLALAILPLLTLPVGAQTRPQLGIDTSGPSPSISWPSPSTGWNLQQNDDLTTANWVAAPAPTDNDTIKYLILNPATGNLCFRLTHP